MAMDDVGPQSRSRRGAEPPRLRDFAHAATSTAPTIWCRRRCCARSPTSIRSSPGTNMPAWLFTILRNLFRSEYRKRRREVEDADGSYAETLKSHPEQNSHVEFKEFSAALAQAAGRPARGADPGRRLGLLLRGSRRDLRLRRRHHQEPRQPRAHAAGRSAARRERRRFRPRPNDPSRLGQRRRIDMPASPSKSPDRKAPRDHSSSELFTAY